ncbi:GNAT family N-acetyltransferase [Kineosporia sp. NBRC 101731]|uniref:GNAT family N-acetyltransferase n=1 Tax=Kineosporia sp. NBRC 101731 TaxID=3032199 RepID=UPI0024A1F7A2|nr:GNAT family N-acetyltransferase [Kineosporia sp. NBRC 101731]GLY29216.1 acetyltransferase [Kineosporia sp. NBRC 101731]
MLTIRPYRAGDLAACYDICVRTGAAGNDARGKFGSDELLGDLFAAPYLTLEPQFAFVLTDDDLPVGYVLGTADTPAYVRRYRQIWVPRLLEHYPGEPAASDRELLELGLHPENMLVPGLEAYPAHLHIDLLPQVQGGGHGRALIERFLQAVHAAGAPAVYLGMDPANTRALGFYERLGFRTLEVGAPDVLYLGRPTAAP